MLKLPALGLDTSNYTTSAALFDGGTMDSRGQLLPVREGELGLRQSDAVFHHTRQLPDVLEALGTLHGVKAIGVSDRPRDAEGSYMPCFLVGTGAARMLGKALSVPVHSFSHQQGHIAAALYSAGRLDLLAARFLAFHLSGGTTEAVFVEPRADGFFSTTLVASSSDVKAGQIIDRVGVMLGLRFPAGQELDELATAYAGKINVRASMRGANCSLSGVENQCRARLERGAPREEIAAFCIGSIAASVDAMCTALQAEYGKLPVLLSGGVASNSTLRALMTERYGAVFGAPRFSTDNAAGIAVLASMQGENT